MRPKFIINFFSKRTNEGEVEDTFVASALSSAINNYTSVAMVEEVVHLVAKRYVEEHYQDIVGDLNRQAILNATSIQVARKVGGVL